MLKRIVYIAMSLLFVFVAGVCNSEVETRDDGARIGQGEERDLLPLEEGAEGIEAAVEQVLHQAENLDLPWQRVINARGEVSSRVRADDEVEQRVLLEDEGVRFDERGRVSLERYGWRADEG